MKILQIALAYFAGGDTYAGTTPIWQISFSPQEMQRQPLIIFSIELNIGWNYLKFCSGIEG